MILVQKNKISSSFVSPACAGMIPEVSDMDDTTISEPRMRGDDPARARAYHDDDE